MIARLLLTATFLLCQHAPANAQQAAFTTGPATAVAPDCARQNRLLQRQPACAIGNTVCLVAWSDGTRTVEHPTADIYCARIDVSGKTLDPAGICVCRAADLQEAPAVAFDGTNFLVVWQDLRSGSDYDIFAARISPEGKVLDPDGFAVIRRTGNQARPAVAFAAGNYLVAWMDARQYPVYGLYATRLSVEGKVLDGEGRPLDVEDPAQIAKFTPPAKDWLGDRHYWWDRLTSRFQPTLASDGKTCLVTYLGEVHSNKTTGYALRVDPSECAPLSKPVKLSGEPRDRIAACAFRDGWLLGFDQWIGGWGYEARMAAMTLDRSGMPRQEIAENRERRLKLPEAPMLDLQKLLADKGGEYQQGKGHAAFWQAAVACNARSALVVMDYSWRTAKSPSELHYVVVASRLAPDGGRFLDNPPRIVASGSSVSKRVVRRPVLAAMPDGGFLVFYENDAGIDRLTIEARHVK